jgi:hypothetical protein
MARRHLTLTLDITLDEDLCRDAETKVVGDGTNVLDDDLNYLRTTVAHETGRLLRGYDVQHDNPRIDNCGITYKTRDERFAEARDWALTEHDETLRRLGE